MMSKMEWKAIHIFYYDNQDYLLLKLINSLVKKYNIQDFFFIRYWESGPHVRFRFKSKRIKELERGIETFLRENPSSLEINKDDLIKINKEYYRSENIKKHEPVMIASNNSFKEFKYYPEYNKYFGKNGVEIAEEEFIFSSKLVLILLSINKDTSFKIALACIFFRILIDIIYTNEDAKKFLEIYRQYWLHFENYNNLKIEHEINLLDNMRIPLNSENKLLFLFKRLKVEDFHKTIFFKMNKNQREKYLFNFLHLFNNRLGLTPKYEIIVSTIVKNYYESI